MKRIAIPIAAFVLACLWVASSAPAAERIWANTGTNYNLGISWTPAVAPGVGDVARFFGNPGTQPNITASVSNAGISFALASVAGWNLTATGGATLTLTGYSTSGQNGNSDSTAAAIRSEMTSGTDAVSAPLILAPAMTGQSTFFQASGGTLAVNGAISSAAGVNLSLRGGGTVQLNGNNSFATGSIDTAGETVVIGHDNGLGAGTFTINNTATLQAGGGTRTVGNAIVLDGTTTLGGTNAFVFNGPVTVGPSAPSRTLTVNNPGGATFFGNIFLSGAAGTGHTLTIDGTGPVVMVGSILDYNGSGTPGTLAHGGTGTLTLTAPSGYSGGTLLSGGITNVAVGGALGPGNVSLTAGAVTLTLGGGGISQNFIADTANLSIGFTTDVVNLNFTGVDTIGTLTVNGTAQSPGLYGSTANNPGGVFTGTGLVLVTAIPEPSTYLLFGMGLLACGQRFRRLRRRAHDPRR